MQRLRLSYKKVTVDSGDNLAWLNARTSVGVLDRSYFMAL